MFSALGIGRSGLHANQYKLDSVADEIANVGTDGYKKSNVSFQELLPGEDVTLGTKAGIKKLDFSQGVPRETGYRWDFAIEGDGFFSLVNADGDAFFTRDGAFQLSQEGTLVDYAGNALVVEYNQDLEEIPVDTMQVNAEGGISGVVDGEVVQVGRIPLFMPENPQQMIHIGEGKFLPAAGDQVFNSVDNPDMFGSINQGFLESSNSDLTRAMTEMITAQRAYSLNSQAIRSTDDIMRMINEMKR
jgi:flagellar basal-body rod protein FlgG